MADYKMTITLIRLHMLNTRYILDVFEYVDITSSKIPIIPDYKKEKTVTKL